MKIRSTSNFVWFALLCALFWTASAQATTGWSSQDYDLYSGDFDGDGYSDILYIAKDPSRPSGIARSDGSGANIPWQTWPSNYLGIPWSGGQYKVIVGDFNGDGKADIFLQSSTPGNHYVLYTSATGKVVGIGQAIAEGSLGLTWSADQHRIVAADFNGDGRTDLFLQATSASGLNAVILAGSGGAFSAISQSWSEGYLGFKWSASNAIVYAGDFNGDGRGDLLIQARPKIVLIDYDIPIPVPTYPPNLNGIVYGQAGSASFSGAAMAAWSRQYNGVDWSPLTNRIVTGDFNGDGKADVLLQGRNATRTSYLLAGGSGGPNAAAPVALSASIPITADAATLLAGNFGSSGRTYVQATTAAGTNYTAALSGGTLTLTVHNTSLPSTTAVPSAVGRTVGSFAVSNMGGAAYSIPIVVPPGVSGIQPQLSLGYQSGGGNGLVGVGWGLSGLSEIERCKKTLAQDGVNAGVALATSDVFCLDGNRLRLVSGTYGAAGSTYQTELETFARITAVGSAGNGPASFTVEAKDGRIYEYGNTADSFIESTASGLTTTARVWALNKVSDRYGNTLTIAYQEDGATGNGSFRPLTISYTSNGNAGIAAAYQVRFVWETRPAADTLTQYFAGGLITETNRLKAVETWWNDPSSGWRAVRKYQLGYNTSGLSPRSRLVSVQECDTSGLCLAPTTVSWQDMLPGFGTDTTALGLGSLGAYAMAVDLDGDGRTDVVYPNATTGTWWYALALGTGAGYAAPINTGVATNGNYARALPIDYNSDGRTDLLVPNASGNWQVLVSTGSGFSVVATSIAAPAQPGYATVADVNGDGRPDLVYFSGSTLYSRNNTGSGFSATATTLYTATGYIATPPFASTQYALSTPVQAVDLNADGIQDLVFMESYPDPTLGSVPYVDTLLSSPSGYVLNRTSWFGGGGNVLGRPTDLNGDGVSDFAMPCNTGTTWCISIGTAGGGASPIITTSAPYSTSNQVVFLDWDGDGRVDILQGASGGNWQLLRSTGTNLAAPVDTGLPVVANVQPMVADINGDGLPDLVWVDSAYNWHYRLHNGSFADLVTSITDGFGNSVSVTYGTLTDSAVYTKGSGASFPEMDFQAALVVVKSFTSTDGIGGTYSVSESYGGARLNLQGRGLEGFASRVETDSRSGISVTTTFNQQFPFAGTVASVVTRQPNGKAIEDVATQYTDYPTSSATYNDRHYVFAATVTRNAYEVNAQNSSMDGAATTRVVTQTAIESYGTPITITSTTSDTTSGTPVVVLTSVVNNNPSSYPLVNDTSNWCLGFVQQQEVTNTPAGQSAQTRTTRTTRMVKDSTALPKCRISQKVVEPASSSLALTTTYGYDSSGHVTSEAVSGTGITTRTTTTSYGTQGVFPVQVTNAEGESVYKTYDYGFGVPKTATDVNGIVVSWSYDGFGRKTLETRPDGTKTTWTLYSCTNTNGFCGDPLLRYQMQEQQLDASSGLIRYAVQHYDAPGRVKYTVAQTLSGQTSTVQTNYDNQGRVYQRSTPYLPGAGAYFTTYAYDLVGRPLSEQRQTSESNTATRTVSYAYEKLVNKYTDAIGRLTTKQMNAIGQVVSVTDAASGVTQYQYDPFGNLTTTTDPAGNQIVNAYNIRGLKTSTTDPDMGAWQYTYYPTGELNTQTDAKGQLVTFTYDRVGRQKTRVELEGTTTWTYGASQASRNVGQLATVASPGSYSEAYTYDSLGRPSDVTTVADGASYNVANTYNATTGLLDVVTYPTSTSAAPGSRFKAKYAYAYGLLQAVKDADTPTTVFWQANATDAVGHTTSETYGNAVTTASTYDRLDGLLRTRTAGSASAVQNDSYGWDPVGNLNRRQDSIGGLTELFYYDTLNRLDYSTLNGATNLDPSYDAIGNITNKTGVGAYTYTTQQSGCTYTGLTAQPHAVRNAGGTAYCYDKNGNMVKRGADSLTWYSYNLPNQIAKGSNTTTFSYGAGRGRYKQVSYTPSGQNLPAGTETTIYIGGMFEKVTKPSGVVEYKHYLMAGKEAIAIKTLRSSSVNDVRYLHKDHLGSVTTITDESGAVVTRLAYDAFGKRRDAGTWTGSPGTAAWTTIAGVTHRGFTSHEQLDNVDLVHMNGRVYDPNIGRFLSADPIIQAPLMSQSLNRYSYVMNNPLSLIDPSGFSWLSKAFSAIGGLFKSDTFRALLSIAVGIYLPGLPFMAGIFGTFGSYVVTGAIAGGIAAGSLRGALLGGLTAGLFYGAGTLAGMTATSYGSAAGEFARAVGHALAGCISAVAGGGNCGPGALSAGFALLATPTIKNAYLAAVEHGVVGGIASTLGGGSFATGMRNGVAGYLFNCLAHECLLHYREGGGKPLNANFSELGADDVGPEQFKQYRALVSNEDLPDGTYKVEDKLGWQTQSLNARAAYGRVVLLLSGDLTVSNGQFTFSGSITASPDYYDFDKQPWGQRTLMGEVSTRVGSMLDGKPFYNNFQGEKAVNTSGSLSPFCCRR